MQIAKNKFSILIATKNRKIDLGFTLNKIYYLFDDNLVDCVVYDDGSTDGTLEYIKQNFPKIKIFRNEISKGYLFCRNKMLNETDAEFAISLDDDSHFVTQNPLEKILRFFNENPKCGLIALRLFWSKDEPSSIDNNQLSEQVKGFVGCGHVWRMKAWRDIPNYPEWFVFYGEEDFASYQLFKKNWEVQYFPEILVHHRVDLKARKFNSDYSIRLRRSLRSGWYLYFLFIPIKSIPRKFIYSIWVQLNTKVFKGDLRALKAIIQALFDLVVSIPKILKNSKRLSIKEYLEYQKLEDTKVYWRPENVINNTVITLSEKVSKVKFTIFITTKNRLEDLIFTLNKINYLLVRDDLKCIICDDGSTDNTSLFLKEKYPNIHLIRNEKSKGLIYSRNKLLSLIDSEYAISIDDDLHFITENPLDLIENYFNQNAECALIGFRIFWSKLEPSSTFSSEKPVRMKSFPGGAHVLRMNAWKQIREYPSWFIFYGEEDFAAYELFKKRLQVHYLPSVLVHHRVELKERKKQKDYTIRLRRSLRSGWYLYFLFFPLKVIPRKMFYSVWVQLSTKVFKGDFRALQAIIQASFDFIIAIPKIIKNSNRFTINEFIAFKKLEDVKLYWKPEK